MSFRAYAATLRAKLPEPESADYELRMLISKATGQDANLYFIEPDRQLPKEAAERVKAMVERRATGEPLAYILGEVGFMDLVLAVTPEVLIPRPATETLVWVLMNLPLANDARMLDLGTGSGAIALSIAAARPNWQLTATDISTAALAVAKANAERHNLTANISFRQSDWFASLGGARFDVIAANPPYISASDPCLQGGGLTFEPQIALVGGDDDGMEHLTSIIAEAPAHLNPDGWLVLEHGHVQGEDCRGRLRAAGFTTIATHNDLDWLPRVSVGQAPRA